MQQLGPELDDGRQDPAQHLRRAGAARRERRHGCGCGIWSTRCVLSQPGLSRKVARLEEEGLVERLPDPDGRPRRAGPDDQVRPGGAAQRRPSCTSPASSASSPRGSPTRRRRPWPGCSPGCSTRTGCKDAVTGSLGCRHAPADRRRRTRTHPSVEQQVEGLAADGEHADGALAEHRAAARRPATSRVRERDGAAAPVGAARSAPARPRRWSARRRSGWRAACAGRLSSSAAPRPPRRPAPRWTTASPWSSGRHHPDWARRNPATSATSGATSPTIRPFDPAHARRRARRRRA